ncbi:putative DNA primase/helicase [Roseovarius sp. MBR-154]|jgi:P4 family phage/plasmid primase-like protien
MGILDDLVARPRTVALTLPERLKLTFNDEDNAARLLAVYGPDLVYVTGRGWAVWDGTRYSFRSGDLAAMEVGHKLRSLVLEEARFAREEAEFPDWQIANAIAAATRARPPQSLTREDAIAQLRRETAGKLQGHAVKCGNVHKVTAAMTVARYRTRAEVEDMDADPWRLAVPNGEIDLRAVADYERPAGASRDELAALRAPWLRETARYHRPTKCAGALFDPHAEAPKWEEFLALIQPDEAVRAALQRSLGACLLGENRAQVALFLRGPGGNGKSTLLNVFQHVMGMRDGYAQPCKIEMFLDTGNAGAGAATPEEVNLPGARAYVATEPDARDVLSTKKIKALTGGDRRMSRGNFQDFFFWTPRGVPLISCNRTPKIKGEDDGTKRRLIFIPFDVNLRALPPERQRAQAEVEAELRAEASGILNWLLEGLSEFLARGIDPPEVMLALKARLLESGDPVGTFLSEMIEEARPSEGERIRVAHLYRVYERWCDDEGRTLYQPRPFGDVMVEKGHERGKHGGHSVWRNIRWAQSAAPLVADVLGLEHAPTAAPAPPSAEPPPF